jgi:3-carboxy-cis,cis-muconate cycloisomerase
LPSDDLFGVSTDADLFGVSTDAMTSATGATAWVARMLQVETALAGALEGAGVAPAGTGERVATVARALVEVDARTGVAILAAEARRAGTAVIPLVARLSAAVEAEQPTAGGWVHLGATSQDIVDTALALTARDAAAVVRAHSRPAVERLAALADAHRHSIVAGRTLLQQGAPTTFGLKAAGWLVAVIDAVARLDAAASAMPVQLGGPVGTLGVLGTAGPEVLRQFAHILGLPEPLLPADDVVHRNEHVAAPVRAVLEHLHCR